MRKFKFLPFFIVMIIIAISFSCEKVYLTEPPEIIIDTTVVYSYADTIQPIWNSKCLDCHSGAVAPNLTEGVSYDALLNGGYIETDTTKADQSLIYTKLLSGTHDGRASNTQEALILAWLKQGAKNN